MKHKELLNLLNNLDENGKDTVDSKRVLMIDGLNLFFRNFAMMNMVNPEGVHIGGLGGFFRSLGALIRQIEPTHVYVIFDGAGSANARKNLLPEYKSGRDLQRITNWEAFDDIDDELLAKLTSYEKANLEKQTMTLSENISSFSDDLVFRFDVLHRQMGKRKG
jgi:5'-3' exonuclease